MRAKADYSKCMKSLSTCVLFALFSACLAAQVSAPTALVDNDFVQKQFGTSCTLNPLVSPAVADLDGDGVDDIVIPARCTNPMMDPGQFNYKVIDPFFTFYGYGNPAVTTMYSTELPENRSLVLLIVHGKGKDAWRTPKEKFLIVNLSYKQIDLKKMKMKKKSIEAIYALENGSDQMTSATYWDGRKYRYMPVGSSLESPVEGGSTAR